MSTLSFVSGAHRLVHGEGQQRRPRHREAVFVGMNQILALLLLLVFAPLMLVIAWRVHRHDHGPVVYGHYRVGYQGRLFKCLKFRSMATNSQELLAALLESDPQAREEWARDRKLSKDPRVTPVGDFLRRTSLDELPQLFNVLRGEMLFVGPRPVPVDELRRYSGIRWHYMSVRPGITGLWQVSGRSDLRYEERVELDRRYVESRSLRQDLSILFRTVKVVLLREGAR
jgi:exopolysaccharide production protein ExoY